jgi:hypothetical protein
MKILSIKTTNEFDDSTPDYLGTYDDNYAADAIDRGNHRGQYRYFHPAMTGEETGNPNSPHEDYERYEAFNDGEWEMIGIVAKARVQFTPNGPIQAVHSGGLYGIESDSDQSYLEEVRRDELANLTDELKAIGFAQEQINERNLVNA